ncbi:TRAP transporter small permease [Odoribacter laneus]|mgnify:FL=1|uniref:TRAP transporter small permease n=1 Tax=Odoribacter laneus TaxID=626933 RepID=UPI000334E551|nr:TRAP transporter small permease [Odoribacter laneus]CCZ80463.1 putative uncharacterized protein [Odoribacter laneus CAG:561]
MLRKTIDKILGNLLVFLMAVLVLDVLWQVFSRYVLINPSSYTDECAGYLLIWVGLLGAAYVSGQKEHLAIDILLHKSGAKIRRVLEMLISVFTLLFALTVMVVGGAWLMYTRFILEVTSASLELNMGYVYAVLPLSGGLILYYEIDNLVKYSRGR